MIKSESLLANRLFRIIFGIYFVIALGFTIVQVVLEFRNEKREVSSEISELVNVFLPTISENLWNYNLDTTRFTLNGIFDTKSITGIYLSTDQRDLAIGSYEKNPNNANESLQRYQYEFPVLYPNNINGVKIGHLRVETSSKIVLGRAMPAIYNILINAFLKTLCLWVIFYLAIKFVVAKPLNQLTEVIDGIASNGLDFATRNKLSTRQAPRDDELGCVIQSFENLSLNLYDREQELLNHQENLEETVRERTQELHHQANHDLLTGLPNRRKFERRVNSLISEPSENGINRTSTLGFLDLDRFKYINDVYGHYAGDFVLAQIAELIKNCIREGDTVSRFGGDEFCLLLPHCGLARGEDIANNIVKAINSTTFNWNDIPLSVGASIGLTAFDNQNDDIQDIIRQADSACYVAKSEGRNQVQTFSNSQKSIARKYESHWVDKVKSSMKTGGIELHYQTIAATKNIQSKDAIEVLVRLRDNDDQLIVAGRFMPSIEYYGMAWELDVWVIGQALTFFNEHSGILEKFEFASLNLSGITLSTEGLDTHIKTLLMQNPSIDPNKICFEITESAAVTNQDVAEKNIISLQQCGFKIALDDFGTGFSTFNYLTTFPIDILKIDGNLVREIHNEKHRVMVESIEMISTRMGKRTVAEFVEDMPIYDELTKIGIGYVQGYYIDQSRHLNDLIELNSAFTPMGKEHAVAQTLPESTIQH